MSIFDKILEYVENAPEAGTGRRLNYGKVTMTPYYLKFHGKGQKPERVPISPEDDLTGKVTELTFIQDIAEFNPSLEYEYRRDVRVEANKINKKTGETEIFTTWQEIVKPALLEVLGGDWPQTTMDGVYAETEDV